MGPRCGAVLAVGGTLRALGISGCFPDSMSATFIGLTHPRTEFSPIVSLPKLLYAVRELRFFMELFPKNYSIGKEPLLVEKIFTDYSFSPSRKRRDVG